MSLLKLIEEANIINCAKAILRYGYKKPQPFTFRYTKRINRVHNTEKLKERNAEAEEIQKEINFQTSIISTSLQFLLENKFLIKEIRTQSVEALPVLYTITQKGIDFMNNNNGGNGKMEQMTLTKEIEKVEPTNGKQQVVNLQENNQIIHPETLYTQVILPDEVFNTAFSAIANLCNTKIECAKRDRNKRDVETIGVMTRQINEYQEKLKEANKLGYEIVNKDTEIKKLQEENAELESLVKKLELDKSSIEALLNQSRETSKITTDLNKQLDEMKQKLTSFNALKNKELKKAISEEQLKYNSIIKEKQDLFRVINSQLEEKKRELSVCIQKGEKQTEEIKKLKKINKNLLDQLQGEEPTEIEKFESDLVSVKN